MQPQGLSRERRREGETENMSEANSLVHQPEDRREIGSVRHGKHERQQRRKFTKLKITSKPSVRVYRTPNAGRDY
jgi:hypothetical protein